jgi:hypothetical protein
LGLPGSSPDSALDEASASGGAGQLTTIVLTGVLQTNAIVAGVALQCEGFSLGDEVSDIKIVAQQASVGSVPVYRCAGTGGSAGTLTLDPFSCGNQGGALPAIDTGLRVN